MRILPLQLHIQIGQNKALVFQILRLYFIFFNKSFISSSEIES